MPVAFTDCREGIQTTWVEIVEDDLVFIGARQDARRNVRGRAHFEQDCLPSWGVGKRSVGLS